MWYDDIKDVYQKACEVTRSSMTGDYHVLLKDLDDWCDKLSHLREDIERLDRTDWSKVSVDTLVEIKDNTTGHGWVPRYFAGVNNKNEPMVFCNGTTSITASKFDKYFVPKYIRLKEEE